MENCMIDGWMIEWRIGAVDLVNMNDTSLAYRVGHEDGILCLKDIWFGWYEAETEDDGKEFILFFVVMAYLATVTPMKDGVRGIFES